MLAVLNRLIVTKTRRVLDRQLAAADGGWNGHGRDDSRNGFSWEFFARFSWEQIVNIRRAVVKVGGAILTVANCVNRRKCRNFRHLRPKFEKQKPYCLCRVAAYNDGVGRVRGALDRDSFNRFVG